MSNKENDNPTCSFVHRVYIMRIYLPLLLLAAPFLRAQDVCAPLEDADRILESLQPAPDEHLHSKLPDLAPFGNHGWTDGLGWSQDVSVGINIDITGL